MIKDKNQENIFTFDISICSIDAENYLQEIQFCYMLELAVRFGHNIIILNGFKDALIGNKFSSNSELVFK